MQLVATVLTALAARQEAQAEERRLASTVWHESDLVFSTAIGTPVHPPNDYRAFRRLLTEADLRPVRLHDLRHTAASLLLAQRVPALVVMEILGHSQISVTLNTYTHVDTSLTETALNGMDLALLPSGE